MKEYIPWLPLKVYPDECLNTMCEPVEEVTEDIISELGYEDGEEFSEFTGYDLKNKFTNNSKTKLLEARSITVNTVHGNRESIAKVIKRLNPDIETMEGAAVFQVCESFNIPSIQIRSISNKVEHRKTT